MATTTNTRPASARPSASSRAVLACVVPVGNCAAQQCHCPEACAFGLRRHSAMRDGQVLAFEIDLAEEAVRMHPLPELGRAVCQVAFHRRPSGMALMAREAALSFPECFLVHCMMTRCHGDNDA